MTMKKIEAEQKKDSIKFELAKQIRALIDAARKEYGADDWDGDDIESRVCELVFED